MGRHPQEVSMAFFFDKDIEKTEMDSRSSRKVLAHGRDLMACHLYYEAGGTGLPHTHMNNTQITTILSGRFEFTLSGDTAVLTSGDSVYIPSGAEHSIACLEKGELIDVFTPEREDFI